MFHGQGWPIPDTGDNTIQHVVLANAVDFGPHHGGWIGWSTEGGKDEQRDQKIKLRDSFKERASIKYISNEISRIYSLTAVCEEV